jgi:hypothetical protein
LGELIFGKPPPVAQNKSEVGSKVSARTEYTRTEIQAQLPSIEESLSVVERYLAVTDESWPNAVDIGLDQHNFAILHTQYETIGADLINPLNSS